MATINDIKALDDAQLEQRIGELNSQVDSLKVEVRMCTRVRANRAARAKLAATIKASGLTEEQQDEVLAKFDQAVEEGA